jgi:subtilase family serine protease
MKRLRAVTSISFGFECFAPREEDAEAVRDYLTSYGLTILTTEPNNLWVEAKGSVANAQKAFTVQLHNFRVDGKINGTNRVTLTKH